MGPTNQAGQAGLSLPGNDTANGRPSHQGVTDLYVTRGLRIASNCHVTEEDNSLGLFCS